LTGRVRVTQQQIPHFNNTPLIRLVIWLSVHHGMRLEWTGSADTRTERAAAVLGWDDLGDRIVAAVKQGGTRNVEAVLDTIARQYKDRTCRA
jgi:hypothetical protein